MFKANFLWVATPYIELNRCTTDDTRIFDRLAFGAEELIFLPFEDPILQA
jgi:hypothetical protein